MQGSLTRINLAGSNEVGFHQAKPTSLTRLLIVKMKGMASGMPGRSPGSGLSMPVTDGLEIEQLYNFFVTTDFEYI